MYVEDYNNRKKERNNNKKDLNRVRKNYSFAK